MGLHNLTFVKEALAELDPVMKGCDALSFGSTGPAVRGDQQADRG